MTDVRDIFRRAFATPFCTTGFEGLRTDAGRSLAARQPILG